MKVNGTTAIILVMFISPSANALSLKLSESITYSGSLEHLSSFNKIGEAEPVITNISSVRLNMETFLWRPWIATLNSNLALSYSKRESSNDSTGQNITGDIHFSLFPQSKFPFTAFFKKRSNQVEGDLTDQNLTSTAWGFSQVYVARSTRLNINYQHLLEEDKNSTASSNNRTTEDVEDTLNLTLSSRIGNHDFSANSKFSFVERPDQFQRDDQMLHVLRYNYRSGTNLTVNNLFTYSDRVLEQRSGAETDLKIVQFNSNVFWRPQKNNKILVTTTVLLQGTGDIEKNDFGIFDSMGVSGQVNYQWNPYLNLRTLANVNKSDTRTQTLQRLGAEYTPAETSLFGFRHAYNVSADLSNITDDVEQGRQEINFRAGHILNRNYPSPIGNINVSATQRGASILNSRGKIDRTLSHTIGAGWNYSINNSTNSVRLTLSDTRRFSNEEDEFGLQQANLHLSRNHQLNRDSSFNGNITIQANRTLGNNNTGENLSLNSSVSIVYNHSRLFGLPRLRYLSEIRYLSDSLFEVINSDGFDDDKQNDIFWQNRLYYGIGRLSFRLTATTGLSDGEFNNFVLLQVRRNFGR